VFLNCLKDKTLGRFSDKKLAVIIKEAYQTNHAKQDILIGI
jgi:hypothetical protein